MKKFSQYLICLLVITFAAAAQPGKEDLSFLETYNQLKEVEVTPKATPLVKQGMDICLNLDYIAWVPSEGGLAIAQSEVPAPGATTH